MDTRVLRGSYATAQGVRVSSTLLIGPHLADDNNLH